MDEVLKICLKEIWENNSEKLEKKKFGVFLIHYQKLLRTVMKISFLPYLEFPMAQI